MKYRSKNREGFSIASTVGPRIRIVKVFSIKWVALLCIKIGVSKRHTSPSLIYRLMPIVCSRMTPLGNMGRVTRKKRAAFRQRMPVTHGYSRMNSRRLSFRINIKGSSPSLEYDIVYAAFFGIEGEGNDKRNRNRYCRNRKGP